MAKRSPTRICFNLDKSTSTPADISHVLPMSAMSKSEALPPKSPIKKPKIVDRPIDKHILKNIPISNRSPNVAAINSDINKATSNLRAVSSELPTVVSRNINGCIDKRISKTREIFPKSPPSDFNLGIDNNRTKIKTKGVLSPRSPNAPPTDPSVGCGLIFHGGSCSFLFQDKDSDTPLYRVVNHFKSSELGTPDNGSRLTSSHAPLWSRPKVSSYSRSSTATNVHAPRRSIGYSLPSGVDTINLLSRPSEIRIEEYRKRAGIMNAPKMGSSELASEFRQEKHKQSELGQTKLSNVISDHKTIRDLMNTKPGSFQTTTEATEPTPKSLPVRKSLVSVNEALDIIMWKRDTPSRSRVPIDQEE